MRRLTLRSAPACQADSARLRLLDVGCSRGQLRCHCRTPWPSMPKASSRAARIAGEASAQAGLKVHTQGLLEEQAFPADSFDVVTSVRSHRTSARSHPLWLPSAGAFCVRAGILVLSTGNAASWTAAVMKAGWDYFQIEKDAGHISFFNPRSVRVLAARCESSGRAHCHQARARFGEKGKLPGWSILRSQDLPPNCRAQRLLSAAAAMTWSRI